jgi:hypothetical protein
MKIKLADIVEQLEMTTDTGNSFLNRTTGELFYMPDDIFGYVEDADENDDYQDLAEWERELVLIAKDINETNNYVRLPGKFDLNEYDIMEKFCLSIGDDKLREMLYYSIKGSGAFRRFKENIRSYGIEADWFEYKKDELRRVAIDWCESNNIEIDAG